MEKKRFKLRNLFTGRFWRVVFYTFDKFAENRMGFQCVSLSYFVTLAIVPMLAFIFAVSGGLGVEDKVTAFLHEVLPSAFTYTDVLVEKSRNIIEVANLEVKVNVKLRHLL